MAESLALGDLSTATAAKLGVATGDLTNTTLEEWGVNCLTWNHDQ